MAVPGGITSLSTVAASNGPDGATELPSVLDDYERTTQALLKRALSIGGSLSATFTLNVPDDYRYIEIQSAGEIGDIDDSTSWDGREISARFNAICTLTHSTNFTLPGSAQIVTAAGDHAKFVRRTSGVWNMVSYEQASGVPVIHTRFTKSSANVSFSTTLSFYAGPSVAQGSVGTWFASGQLTLQDTAGAATFLVRMTDGTTVIDSCVIDGPAANRYITAHLSGYIASPAGNIRIEARDTSSGTGHIIGNDSGGGHDSKLSVFRIA